jgi:hypothetical protein
MAFARNRAGKDQLPSLVLSMRSRLTGLIWLCCIAVVGPLTAVTSGRAVEIDSAEQTTLRQGGTTIRITREDATAIRTGLLKALRRSDVADRDELIAIAEPLPAWIDGDGRVMIAGWQLALRSQGLVVTQRLAQNCANAYGYLAKVEKRGSSWRVAAIMPEKIRMRC